MEEEEEEECHLEVRNICCNRFSPISVHYFFSKAHTLSLGPPDIQVCLLVLLLSPKGSEGADLGHHLPVPDTWES